ncbi:MAG TPA: hypothetical protein EYQ73_04870 [Candidatus Poseidoniales archaeon]|nr:hypothetical protein [Candidatus Poseidoniales archaeon]
MGKSQDSEISPLIAENPSTKPLENPLQSNQDQTSFLLTFVRVSITIPIIIIWIIVGLYIWIPLVLRRLIYYVGAIVSSAITRETDNVVLSGVNLEHSLSFFFDGFILIFHSLGLTGRHLGEQKEEGSLRAKEEFMTSTIIWSFIGMIWLLFYIIINEW